jgi:hypothetical protein
MLDPSSSPSANVPSPKIIRRAKTPHKHGPSHTDLGTAARRQIPKILTLAVFSKPLDSSYLVQNF